METLNTSVEFLTVKEVAALTKLSIPTIMRYTKSNLLPTYTLGKNNVRYKKDEVIAAFTPIAK